MFRVSKMYREGIGVTANVSESEKWLKAYGELTLMWHIIWGADLYRNIGKYDYSLELYKLTTTSMNPNILQTIYNSHITNGLAVSHILELFKNLIDAGNPDAMFRLGNIYYERIGIKKDYSCALDLYKKSANLGNPGSMLRLGEMYRDGKGVNPHNLEASNWFIKAGKLGNISALNNVVTIYASGVLKNEEIYNCAINLLKGFANMGNIDAIIRLDNYYYYGIGVKKDYQIAASWYEKSAKLGNSLSKMRLGEMYRDGKGVPVDIEKAMKWFTE